MCWNDTDRGHQNSSPALFKDLGLGLCFIPSVPSLYLSFTPWENLIMPLCLSFINIYKIYLFKVRIK